VQMRDLHSWVMTGAVTYLIHTGMHHFDTTVHLKSQCAVVVTWGYLKVISLNMYTLEFHIAVM
jgi:hypothetical protein